MVEEVDGDEGKKRYTFRDSRSEEHAAQRHAKNCQLAFDKAVTEFSSPTSIISLTCHTLKVLIMLGLGRRI